MPSLFKTKAIDLDTITGLLQGEQKAEDEKYLHQGKEHLFYIHGFDRKMLYLFDLPYEQMFVPEKSTSYLSEGRFHCIACGAIGIENRESHFNWHKKDLYEKDYL